MNIFKTVIIIEAIIKASYLLFRRRIIVKSDSLIISKVIIKDSYWHFKRRIMVKLDSPIYFKHSEIY